MPEPIPANLRKLAQQIMGRGTHSLDQAKAHLSDYIVGLSEDDQLGLLMLLQMFIANDPASAAAMLGRDKDLCRVVQYLCRASTLEVLHVVLERELEKAGGENQGE